MKDWDKQFIKNWRPISLLNVDTKILSKVFKAKLEPILPSVISWNQSAYVEKRCISESGRLISDSIEISQAVVQRCSVKKVWPATLLKKRLLHRCFPVNFAKFLRTPFFTEYLWWLLLKFSITKLSQDFWWLWILSKLLIPWTMTFYCVLKKFDFGDNLITWIETWLNDQQSCVNKWRVCYQYFTSQKGACQGDPK